MAQRAARLPSGADDVLAALLTAAGGSSTVLELSHLARRSVGSTLRALIALEAVGWVARSPGGYRLATVHDDGPRRTGLVAALPMQHAVAADPVGSFSCAVIDIAVARFGFLDAAWYREQLRCAVAGRAAREQWAQALSTVVLRAVVWRTRSCRFGRHELACRHDSSSSVGHTYFECARCGAFQNSLFGDVVDRRARESPSTNG